MIIVKTLIHFDTSHTKCVQFKTPHNSVTFAEVRSVESTLTIVPNRTILG